MYDAITSTLTMRHAIQNNVALTLDANDDDVLKAFLDSITTVPTATFSFASPTVFKSFYIFLAFCFK